MNITSIYESNAFLITEIRKAIDEYRKQYYQRASFRINKITELILILEHNSFGINLSNLNEYCKSLLNAFDERDHVLCADILSAMLNDSLIPIQSELRALILKDHGFDPSYLNRYNNKTISIEDTLSGYPTIKSHTCGERYLCSNEDPMKEGYELAREAFDPKAYSYTIWGMGLGYHIIELMEITNEAPSIYVYDNESFLFDIAKDGILGSWQKKLNTPKIHMIYDPDSTKFMESLNREHNRVFIHMPSVYKLPETNPEEINQKNVLKKLQIYLTSFEQAKDYIYLNFYQNIRNVNNYAEELFCSFKDKHSVVIAAGPSLDKNIDVLKSFIDEGLKINVFAVGTVFKKLINKGIIPDAVFFMDANPRIYEQIEHITTTNVNIILDSTAYYKIGENYKGPKYLACQKDFEQAEKLGHVLFETGHSVLTLVLDFAIKTRSKSITMMGCDLAFTGGLLHASDTMDQHTFTDKASISVRGFYGDEVATSASFSMYKQWIENRIVKEDAIGIPFYNATEGGAYIEGMKHMKLIDLKNIIY